MKSFKKFLALLLTVLCIFSITAVGSSASDIIEDFLDITTEVEEEEMFQYGIHYEIDSLSGVAILYKPNPDITFELPCEIMVSGDFPLSIDYECYAWRDENGKLWYPGDIITCEGKVILYAVWEEKSDNDPRAIRAIKTGFQALIRVLQKFLGIFEVINTPESELTTTTKPTTTKRPIIVPTTKPTTTAGA